MIVNSVWHQEILINIGEHIENDADFFSSRLVCKSWNHCLLFGKSQKIFHYETAKMEQRFQFIKNKFTEFRENADLFLNHHQQLFKTTRIISLAQLSQIEHQFKIDAINLICSQFNTNEFDKLTFNEKIDNLEEEVFYEKLDNLEREMDENEIPKFFDNSFLSWALESEISLERKELSTSIKISKILNDSENIKQISEQKALNLCASIIEIGNIYKIKYLINSNIKNIKSSALNKYCFYLFSTIGFDETKKYLKLTGNKYIEDTKTYSSLMEDLIHNNHLKDFC